MSASLQDLVYAALPCDLRPDELMQAAPENCRNPHEKLMTALRDCPRLNWQAYLERNPDVKASGMDPCLHFLANGVHEGRKLVSWHPLKQKDKAGAPLISAIIVCNNNETHLRKCLASVRRQTLSDLEIIFVDDASSDRSLALAQECAAHDKRIKILANEKNSGTFMSRKKAVLAANGRYITFVDADDFLHPQACEILYREIIKGYDIVDAGAIVVNTTRADAREIDYFLRYRNVEAEAVFEGNDLPRRMFVEIDVPWNIWGKLFLREICVAAYSDLKDGFFIRTEDKYGMMAISRLARNIKRITDKIYYYNFGIGDSTSRNTKKTYKKWLTLGDTTKALEEYALRYNLDVDIDAIKSEHFRVSFHKWLAGVPDNEAGFYFKRMREQFGLDCMLGSLVDNFQKHQEKIANKFRHFVRSDFKEREPKRIGIYYHRLTRGAVQTINADLAAFLIGQGFEVIFFSEERNRDELELPRGAKAVYIGSGLGGNDKLKRHLREFNRALAANPVDLMLYATTLVPYMLWDLILLDSHAVPVIGFYHNDHNWAYINNDANYPHHAQEAVFRCLAALTCLSTPSELYFRAQGINACYIPNPVKLMPEREWDGEIPQKIAVMGRLGDPIKQIGQSLRILKKVIQKRPHVKMLLIGDFMNDAQRRECRDKIRALGIEGSVILCGRTDRPNDLLSQCGVLLSTSYNESFGMAIAEAQALGIPCVMYALPIELAQNNPAIIQVPQNDIAAAADAIVALLDDPARWQELSLAARKAVQPYSQDIFNQNMLDLIKNYRSRSPWREYSQSDYERAIKAAGFYAGRSRPGRWY